MFFGTLKNIIPFFTLTELDAVDSPTNRDLYVLAYDFSAAPQDYDNNDTYFGSQGILPAGATMIAFGFENIEADVYHNDGSPYSNWASEVWMGCTYLDPVEGLTLVGTFPFTENEGPGHFGPSNIHFDLNPNDWPLPTEDEFQFYVRTSFDDGSGLAAGTFTSGLVYIWVESPVVANEDVTLDAIKTLFR